MSIQYNNNHLFQKSKLPQEPLIEKQLPPAAIYKNNGRPILGTKLGKHFKHKNNTNCYTLEVIPRIAQNEITMFSNILKYHNKQK